MAGWSEREPALTPRQRDVLERVAKGRTNAEIAAELGIGYETVKMHVAHVLAALDVSTREEAARVWRGQRRVVARPRWGWLSFGGMKLAAGAAGVVVVAGAAIGLVLAMGGGDDASPGATSDLTATATVPTFAQSPATAVATPSPAPVDVGWEAAAAALSFEFSSFEADALQTNLSLVMPGSDAFRETGPALVWVTDTAGVRTRFVERNSRDYATGEIRQFTGPALEATPGELLIEVEPVRDYVVPALGANESTPKWATFRVPFDGYTGTITSVPPPAPFPFAGGTMTVTEVLVGELQTRVSLRYERTPPYLQVIGLPIVFFTPGGSVHYGSGGGGGESVMTFVYRFDPLSGPVTLLLREAIPPSCPEPGADSRPTPTAQPTPGTVWQGECVSPNRSSDLPTLRANWGLPVVELDFVLP